MEMTAGLWENSWELPSRIRCNQFSHRLKRGRKYLTKDSHTPHNIAASNFIAAETQVPSCFWKVRADSGMYSRMGGVLLLDSTLWFGRSVTDGSETTVEPFARSTDSHQASGHTQAAVGTVPFLAWDQQPPTTTFRQARKCPVPQGWRTACPRGVRPKSIYFIVCGPI